MWFPRPEEMAEGRDISFSIQRIFLSHQYRMHDSLRRLANLLVYPEEKQLQQAS